MVKGMFWVVLGWLVLGCGEGSGDGGEGGSSGVATGGSAGETTGGTGAKASGGTGAKASGGSSDGGAGVAGSATGGSGGSGVTTLPGVIETGPDCLPRGPDADELGSAYEELFEMTLGNVVAIETGPSGAYFATDASLYRLAPDSTAPELVVEDDDFGYPNSPGADGMLRVDASHVYWASSSDIRRAAVDDFVVETIVADVANVDFLEIDAESVYFCVRETNVIYKAPLAGGAAVELSRDEVSVQDMKVDSGYVYVSEFESGRVARFPVGGGPVEYVSPAGLFMLGIRPSGDTVYWADDGGLYSTPLSSPNSRMKLSRPTTSGPFGAARVNNLVLREDRLFWRDSEGNVGWTKTDGSQCDVTVADNATEFAVDAEYVYVNQARIAF